MHRLVLVLILIAGCKKSRKDECDELADMAIRIADELGKQLGGKKTGSFRKDPEIRAEMEKFRAQCMQWPEEVFQCMKANDETSPKCKQAMEHVTGVVETEVDKAPDGPAIMARATLGEASWDGMPSSLADDGSLVAAPTGAVVAFDATGKALWRTELEHRSWMVALDTTILVGEQSAIVALDRASGERAWTIDLPAVDEYTSQTGEGAVRIGAHVFVATSDANVMRLDPAACAKPKQKGCLEAAFSLAGEAFDAPKLSALGQDIVLAEQDAIRRFSQTGKLLSKIHIRDDLGGVAVAGDRVVASFDDELVVLDLAKCSSRPIALPRKRGRMYIRGEGDCEDCIAPPQGCAVRSEVSDVSSDPPFVLRDGSIVVDTMDGVARIAPNGNKHWVASVNAYGPIREIDDSIVFGTRNDDDDLEVVALVTATGRAKWKRPLDIKVESSSSVIVQTAGTWIVAGGHAVAWIARQ